MNLKELPRYKLSEIKDLEKFIECTEKSGCYFGNAYESATAIYRNAEFAGFVTYSGRGRKRLRWCALINRRGVSMDQR